MSPYNWNSSNTRANVFYVYSDGRLANQDVNWTSPGLRPVINLESDTQFQAGGIGTQSNPYVVQ